MKILFAGGGTAGHINPALSIAERLNDEDEAKFIIREDGPENKPIIEGGYSYECIKTYGLSGGIFKIFRALRSASSSTKRACAILKEFSPDIVFATGGYVSYPVLRSAKSLGIKTVIHESNLKSGLVTRLFAKKVDLILLPKDSEDKDLISLPNAKTVGTPIRRAFFDYGYQRARRILGIPSNTRLIISQGGSLGAEVLNGAILRLMKTLSKCEKNIIHIHSSGKRYYDKIKGELCHVGEHMRVLPYIDDMPLYLSAADLIICRAGASTISEIAVCKTPAILIPSPNVAGDHQSKNARGYIKESRGEVIYEKELTDGRLYKSVMRLLNDNSLRKSLYKNTEDIKSRRDEAEKILKMLRKMT